MTGLILIFLFVILLAVPGFYLITRWVFPQGSKKNARRIALGLTILLVAALAAGLIGQL